MATRHIETGTAPVTLPGSIPPAPAVMRILDRFNRDELGNTIEVLVALLDIWDAPGDPDEPDFRQLADTDLASRNDGKPGDPDDGEHVGDELDHSWPEWHARGKKRVTAGGYEMAPPTGLSPSEDDEDDDPAEEDDPQGECSEDEISCAAGHWGGYRDFRDQGPGCPYSDAGIADDGALAEAHGVLSAPPYGIDQTQPLGVGHEV